MGQIRSKFCKNGYLSVEKGSTYHYKNPYSNRSIRLKISKFSKMPQSLSKNTKTIKSGQNVRPLPAMRENDKA